ncbi:hypothetical protein KEM52_001641 [Ascosphaera acerosa]|nr:hypothetical protein KEM52_001641 [Ascosphaera acerosa]
MESRAVQLGRLCRAGTSATALRQAARMPRPAVTATTVPARSYATPADQASQSQTQPPAAPPPRATRVSPAPHTIKLRKGTVISAGLMDRTVRVQYSHETFHKHLNKPFPAKTVYMVSDPTNALREGDVVEFSNGWPASRNVRHVVERIVAPFGSRVEDRPRILTREEREALREQKREKKLVRKEERLGAEAVARQREGHVGKIKRLVQQRMAAMSEEERLRLQEA